MKLSRLEQLYRQKLVSPDSGKVLPIENILNKPVDYYPEKPEKGTYDILEIGPGRGDFLFHLCDTNPNKRIVAVELMNRRFDKLVSNHKKRKLENLTLIHGDARVPVSNHFSNDTFENVYVLFPDPWPRNRHRHKRLLQQDFLETLCQKMKVGGEFLLVTDVQDYALWCHKICENLPAFANQNAQASVLEGLPADIVPTFFAEKWKELGRSCWSVRMKKIANL